MKQLLAMLRATADGAFVVDQHGNVIFWNHAAERMLGYRESEVLGQPCHEVIQGQSLCGLPLCSAHCAIASRLACGRAVRNFDMQTRTKDRRPIWLNMSSLPFPSRQNQPWMAAHLFRNITKHAKAQKLMEELHTALCWNMPGQNTRCSKEPSLPLPPIQRELPLSDREREVLRLLAEGEDTKQIADRLCISPATVRNHTQHILEKLGAHSRLQALAIAFHPGALPSAPPDKAQR